jgi:hypothetical protein
VDVADDPQLRALVEASRAWGISPKRMLGWEPKQTTIHEYDLTGNLARSTTTTEPEWDQEQRDLVFAFLAWEADLCPGCKQPMVETTKAENEGRYVPGPAIRCHRCTASEQASKPYEGSPSPQALFIPIQLREQT